MTSPRFDSGIKGAPVQLVIFDIDGTLIDSVDLHAQAWREAFLHFDKDFEFMAIRNQIGKGGNELLSTFLSHTEMENFGDDLKEYRGQLFKEKFIDSVKPFAKVRELFEQIKHDGKKVAVGSSAHEEEVDYYLQRLNVTDLVDLATSSDDVDRAKPHPDIFTVALQRGKCEPAQAIVIGDSPYDAQAAKKAGIACAAVLCGGFDREMLLAAGADKLYADPADLLKNYDSWAVG